MVRWLPACALVFLAACQPRGGVDVGELRGWPLDPPVAKPDFVLATTEGDSFDFQKETDGFVTLLFFGFTNCPDVCPLHMANIDAAMEKLPPNVASRIKVVFVATDVERDHPERVREWLDHFSTDFIGLVGDLDEINQIERGIGLGASYREEWPDGGYGMAHAAAVLAFTTDNLAHVSYPFGIRQVDWAFDLPRLVGDPGP